MSSKINQQFACSKMMLPEHRVSLRDQSTKAQWKETHRRPLFDEQRQDELQQILGQAILKRQTLQFTILNSSGYRIYSGVPLRIEQTAGKIILDTGDRRTQAITAAEVVQLEVEPS
ncbi:MAG: YolD-like family protein [Clostridia bacterium]|nr:YolD-like family protein [Clostridia bacterium]